MDGGRGVDSGDAADIVGGGARAPWGQVGADVDHEIDAEGEELAARVEGKLDARHVVAAVLVGDEAFTSIRRPLHRPAQALGRPQHQHHLWIDAASHPEASADFARHHPHRALGHAEHLLGKQRAQTVRRLDPRIERVAPAASIELADAPARLEGRRGHP